ncbi:hypothetical protein AB0F13_24965 [Streptomyces sp. NPDC026206]|uniref:hypothetical protein n=1 Tax=Streptomyces sp. NPDC026206 TaxID=3157089 RepID=UPI0033FD7FC5
MTGTTILFSTVVSPEAETCVPGGGVATTQNSPAVEITATARQVSACVRVKSDTGVEVKIRPGEGDILYDVEEKFDVNV